MGAEARHDVAQVGEELETERFAGMGEVPQKVLEARPQNKCHPFFIGIRPRRIGKNAMAASCAKSASTRRRRAASK